MTTESDIELVRTFLTRFKAGEYDSLHELQAQVDWDIFPGRAEKYIPWMGHFEGPEGADACIKAFDATLTTEQFDVEMFLSGPGQVAGLIRAIWITRDGNRRFHLDFFVLFKVENGKIQSVREFGDTAEAIEAYLGKALDE